MTEERAFAEDRSYHIRVKGSLDEKWADWFEGFVMTSRESGETLLCSAAVDQAALHGVLDRIYGLGLPLLLVVRAECPCSKKSCPSHGQCSECAAHETDRGRQPFCFRRRSRWEKTCTSLIAG